MGSKGYSLSESLKRQLGYIIKECRLNNYNQYKKFNPGSTNPYTKEKFSKDICHYHTLTKLESDFVHDDNIYHSLLTKLGLSFEVSLEMHNENMEKLNQILYKILQAMEYIDDDLMLQQQNELSKINLNDDCIALIHNKLLSMMDRFHKATLNESNVIELKIYAELYKDLYKALFKHSLGVYLQNRTNYTEAYYYLLDAREIYQTFYISKGIISTHIMSNYLLKKDYLNVINLCLEMEEYYILTNNIKRLFAVYSMFSESYLCIKSFKRAKEYHLKIMEILQQQKSLERYRDTVDFNWGLFLVENYEFEEALEPLEQAYKLSRSDEYKLRFTNVILFVLTKLKKENSLINFYIQDSLPLVENAFDSDKIIFRYFLYKYEKNPYYKKYGITKVIPELKDNLKIVFAVLIYEDVYE